MVGIFAPNILRVCSLQIVLHSHPGKGQILTQNLRRPVGVNLLFHILPENLEKADSLVGSDLVEIMKDNAQFIEERYSSKGIIVVNNIDLVPSESFTDKDFPTEHYDQRGRQAVASSVAQQLKKL